MEWWVLVYSAGGHATWHGHFIKQLDIHLLYSLAISLLCEYSVDTSAHLYQDICIQICIAVMYNSKNVNNSSTHWGRRGWVNCGIANYIMGYSLPGKRNKPQLHATVWVKLSSLILSLKSKAQRSYVACFPFHKLKKNWNKKMCFLERHIKESRWFPLAWCYGVWDWGVDEMGGDHSTDWYMFSSRC